MELIVKDKILKFNYCSFQDSLKLIRLTTKILKNNINSLKDILPNAEGISEIQKQLDKNNFDLTDIINILLGALEEPELYDLALNMASNCIYDNQAISQNFFEIPANRGLFIPIIFQILKNNIQIFFQDIKNIQ